MIHIKSNYFIISITVLLLAFSFWLKIPWKNDQASQLTVMQARGVLRVGMIHSPLVYSMPAHKDGKPTGLDYELVNKFAEYLGLELEIISHSNINHLFTLLEDNDIDLLAVGLLYNQQRLNQVREGPTHYSVSKQLVYRLGAPIPKSLADLPGPLVVAADSAQLATLEQLKQSKYPNLLWETALNQTSIDILQRLAENQFDYTVCDSATVAFLQRIYPKLTVAFDLTDEEPVRWYLKRESDDSLYAALLDFYSQMIADGTIARLEEKYLGHIRSFDYVDTRTFLAAIDTVLPRLQPLFKKYAETIDWKLLAAIAYQESHWNPKATSATGVRGLMMLTRATADSLRVKDRTDPEESIQGGAAYLRWLMDKIPKTVPADERIWYALASYNMGYGHMLDARRLTKLQKGNPDSWVDVKTRLPMLSQKRYYTKTTYGYARGYQAYSYVENIRRYQQSIVGYLQKKKEKEVQLAGLNTQRDPITD